MMTVFISMVTCSAFACTALAIVSPFPLARTMDDVAIDMEDGHSHQSVHPPAASCCILYTTEAGMQRAGSRSPAQLREMKPQRGIRIEKHTILAIIEWACLVMTTISACFLIYDVVAHGLFFRSSLLPLAFIITFPFLSVHAERRLDLEAL